MGIKKPMFASNGTSVSVFPVLCDCLKTRSSRIRNLDCNLLRSFRLSVGQNPFSCQIVRHFRIAFYLVKFAQITVRVLVVVFGDGFQELGKIAVFSANSYITA